MEESFDLSDDKFGYDDRDLQGNMDESGWLSNVGWEQLPLPDQWIKVEYDNQDKTD